MVIDCHVHLNDYTEDPTQTLEKSAAKLFETMESAGVAHSVILTSYKVTPHRPSVEEVIDFFKDEPRVSIVEGLRWRLESTKTDLYEMENRIRRNAVKGIKLYPGYDGYAITEPSLEAVFRIAAKYQVPVMIHCGDTYAKNAKVRQAHPLLVDDVAVDYPDVQFVICHLGNPWFQDTAEVLYKNDNVFADISGLTLGDFEYEFERYMLTRVKDMISYMGDPGKQLMYGSDWPLVGMAKYVRFCEGLDLTEDSRANIEWKTAAKLFKIDVSKLKTP